MSVTLEDSANAPLKYAGSRVLTADDEKYTLRLMKKYQPNKYYSKKVSAYNTTPRKTANKRTLNLDASRMF